MVAEAAVRETLNIIANGSEYAWEVIIGNVFEGTNKKYVGRKQMVNILEETEGDVLGGRRRECVRIEMNCLNVEFKRELKRN